MKIKTMDQRPCILKDHLKNRLKRRILKTIGQRPQMKVHLCLTLKKYQLVFDFEKVSAHWETSLGTFAKYITVYSFSVFGIFTDFRPMLPFYTP